MVQFKYFNKQVLLEDFHLEGIAIIAGLNKREGIDFSKIVIKNLDKDNVKVINYKDLIKYSKNFIKDSVIRKRYVVLNQYLLSSYQKKVREPFFVFIGGSSTSGKDTLSVDLQYYLGVDRVTMTDLLRENYRTDILKKYGSYEKVPDKLKPLFKATYRVNEDGLRMQVEYMKNEVQRKFIQQANREYKTWVHTFYILQGNHVIPGIEKNVKGDNKILVIINPNEEQLRDRIFARWEREMGPMNNNNKDKRIKECNAVISIKNRIEDMAIKSDILIINNDSRIGALHLFGEYLIDRLQ